MTITFRRPVGSHRDVLEMEYILALLQTSPRLQQYFTTSDVAKLLMSRHGVVADPKDIESLVDLAGQFSKPAAEATVEPKSMGPSRLARTLRRKKSYDEEPTVDDSPRIDMVQMVAMLLIPHLRQCQEDGALDQVTHVLERSLRQASEGGGLYTVDTLRRCILHLTGEQAEQALLEEMIECAKGNSLESALTDDISDFSLKWKSLKSAHLQDAMSAGKAQVLDQELGSGVPSGVEPKQLKQVFTAPSIDATADTFNRPLFVVLLWTCGVILYFTYVWQNENAQWAKADCDKFSDIGCPIVQGILSWIQIFVHITTLGTAWIFLGSLGNSSTYNKKAVNALCICISMVVIGVCTIGAFKSSAKNEFFDASAGNEGTLYITAFLTILLAGCLLLTRLFDLINLALPESAQEGAIGRVIAAASLRSERNTKQAAQWKMRRFISNALQYHEPHMSRMEVIVAGSSKSSDVLLKFQLDEDEKETVGGIAWAWRRILDGSILTEEGVWLHGRLWACNFVVRCHTLNVNFASLSAILTMSKQFVNCVFLVVLIFFFVTQKNLFVPRYLPPLKMVVPEPPPELLALPMQVSNNETSLPRAFGTFFDFAQNFSLSPLYRGGFVTTLFASSYWEEGFNLTTGIEFSLDVYNELKLTETSLGLLAYGAARFYFIENPPFDIFLVSATAQEAQSGFALSESEYSSILIGMESNVLFPFNVEFDIVSSFSSDPADQRDDGAFFDLSESQYGAIAAFSVLAGLAAATYITLLYIPSHVSTVLMFRSGVLESLRDPYFEKYRTALDVITLLFGSSFWGTLFAVVTTGGVVALVLLLLTLTWGTTITRTASGQLCGMAVIIGVKFLILIALRFTFFSAFFRKKPGAANLFHIVMEVWNVALSVGFILLRAVKFFLIGGFFIARIDTPFLAPGVGLIGGMEIDSYPLSFRKDLLLHEAHRHPFIETIGLCTLLKLRLGPEFGRNPHSCWRILLLLSLCPWLRKYKNMAALTNDTSATVIGTSMRQLNLVQDKEEHETAVQYKQLSSTNETLLQRIQMLEEENKRLRLLMGQTSTPNDAICNQMERHAIE